MRRKDSFTLIELLIAMALTLTVIVVATTALVQLLTMIRRLQSRQNMDAVAKVISERFRREVTSMQPGAAVWLRATASPATVELVFMKGKEMPTDFPLTVGQARLGFTDLLWTRWHWDSAGEVLSAAESTSARWTMIGKGKKRDFWKFAPGDPDPDTNGPVFATLLSIPSLRRQTGTAAKPDDPQAVLDLNGWQSGEPGDTGDYTDLVRVARPLALHCTAVTIEVQSLDGTVQSADGSVDQAWSASGSLVDARDKPDLGRRPSLVRLRFTLADPAIGTASTFSFSCLTPEFTRY